MSCANPGAPRALLVVARPGTGKSRLAREFVERLRRREDVTTLEARAESTSARSAGAVPRDPLRSAIDRGSHSVSQDRLVLREDETTLEASVESSGAGTVHAILRGLVRAAIGLGALPDPEDHPILRRYVRSLPGLEDAERLADFLGDLAGAPRRDDPGVALASARGDVDLMSRWMRRTVREWLAAETARRPVVLVIEDLHWSDEATLAHLGDALRTLRDRPLIILGLARPEVSALFREPWRDVAKLELGGLGARAAERIA